MTNFNFTFQPGVSFEQIIGFEMAGRIWSEYIQDDTAFSIYVALTDELPSEVIGGALPAYVTTDIETVQTALRQDAASSDDDVAIANLNTTTAPNGDTQYSALLNGIEYQASELTITNANAKALGLEDLVSPNSVDGYVIFNDLDDSRYSWDYDFSRTSTASSLELDFLSMALHELGHIMGFISGVDSIENTANQTNQQSPSLFNFFGLFGSNNQATNQVDLSPTSLLDLFRYSDRSADLDAQELTAGEAAYFSIDGGQTAIASLSAGQVEEAGRVEGYQASHWNFETTTVSSDPLLEIPSLTGLLTNPFGSIFNLASDILFLPVNLLSGQYTTVLPASSQVAAPLGVMDPVLGPGSQSTISALDLQALDVIGYDLSEDALSLDYAALLQETQTALLQSGSTKEDFLNAGKSVSFDGDDDFDDDDVIERRRSRVRTRQAFFFQEVDTPGNQSPETPLPSFEKNGHSRGRGTANNDELLGSISTSYGLVGQGDDDIQSQQDEQSYSPDEVQNNIRPQSGDNAFTDTRSPFESVQMLFGISDSLVSGRNGTGSWLYGQNSNPATGYNKIPAITPLSGGSSFFRSWF